MKRMLILSAALIMAITAAGAGAASAAQCRDAKGKFIKCATAATATMAPAKAAPAMAAPAKAAPAMAAKPGPTMAAAKHCKDAKGKFAKCSAPGAHPVG